MKFTLKIWRQTDAKDTGKLVDYQVDGIEDDMSFLEMLDILNDQLIVKGNTYRKFLRDNRGQMQ